MTRNVLLAFAVLALACKVEKTAPDTYKVIAPTPEAKAAAEKAKEEAKEAGEKIKQGTAKAAVKVGGELQRAGEKVKSEATQTGTKTETRSKTKSHH